jgi:hypothetical protein
MKEEGNRDGVTLFDNPSRDLDCEVRGSVLFEILSKVLPRDPK